ncbi:MAG: phospholipase D-like domain-containing protein, partial [Methanomicrobiales archaeon]|nr:phospholipase D-like domain-containing protein [Methanomicrobiales archaeon]
VGGISTEERSVCAAMNRSGIPLLIMATTDSAHARYRYNHAKYMVVDGRMVLVSTENFGLHGYPPQGSRGNRGWGVLIEDPGVARYFGEVFSSDTTGEDVVPYTPALWGTFTPGLIPAYQPRFSPIRVTDVAVTPILAPDTSGEIFSLIARAGEQIEIEQATIGNDSSGRLNPFLAAAVNASRRGIQVRILLDGGRYSVEGGDDNDEMADLVNGIAGRESLPIAARMLEPGPSNLVTLHTKGMIVDRQIVMISSINWNENSPNFNREAGVILESPALGSYYSSVFEEDWARAGEAGGAPGLDMVRLAMTGVVIFILLLLFLRRRR